MKFISVAALVMFGSTLASSSADPTGAAPALVQPAPPQAKDLPQHNEFVSRTKQGGIDIAFFGDSATACWVTTGKEIWDQNLAPHQAVDFGIYNNSAQELLWRLQNGELDGYQAKALVVMIGAVNLMGSESTDSIVAAITACVQEMRKRQPQAVIYLFCTPKISLSFLADSFQTRAATVAQGLAKLDDGQTVHLIDMTDAMNSRRAEALVQLAKVGDPHKLTILYEVWWDALQKPLTDLLTKK